MHGVDAKVKGGRYVVQGVRCWLRPRSERCRLHSGLCATQPLAGVLNKSSTSPASRLCAALRRRAPGNERLHLIRRKWKRNHAQKTPIGGSRRVRYSASVRRTTAVLVGRTAVAVQRGSHTETFFGRLYNCLIVPLHVASPYRPLLYSSTAPLTA